MAKLYFIQSPMNASKSALLLMKAHSFEERGIPFVCLKPSIDDRDGVGVISSRVGIQRECLNIAQDENVFLLILQHAASCGIALEPPPQWVLVDECQFLSPTQIDQLSDVVDELGINVMCYGLRTDFTTELFDGAKRLMELADDINEVKISCSCGRKAIINARVDGDGKIVTSGNQIMIGGNDQYISLCRKCYKDAIKNNKNVK